jgi:hypothetical protein
MDCFVAALLAMTFSLSSLRYRRFVSGEAIYRKELHWDEIASDSTLACLTAKAGNDELEGIASQKVYESLLMVVNPLCTKKLFGIT